VHARRRHRRDVRDVIALWRRTSASDRRAILERRSGDSPPCGAGWFLLGCACLREHDIAAAARAFGAAYHADCDIESAALLTFACLKTSAEDARPETLRRHLLTTWDEMGHPPLGQAAVERRLFEALAESPASPAPSDSPTPLQVLQLACGLSEP
jgi:hypothetical protein